MKKVLMISVIVGVVLVSLGVAGYANAQTVQPPAPNGTSGRGMMDGRGYGMHGMMGGRAVEGGYGPLHQYMLDAWAEVFGMKVEDLQARIDEGETMWVIAQEKGYTWDKFIETMKDVRFQAIQAAVADGIITQEQADWMQSRIEQMGSMGGGLGPCQGGSGHGRSGRGGGRWNLQPQEPAG
ncbi:MAG: hypothetical protein JXB15_07740 [Anaerolineales bacterium]|nr:hypothetical protein [Anaerolineales bacterium]